MFRTVLSLIVSFSCISLVHSENASDIETLVVSASRVPVSSNLTGSSFTVLDRSVIEKRQLSTLSEILRDVPGFSVNRGGVLGSTTQIRVRGAEGNQVMVFIDGMEVNDLAQGSEFNFAHLSASEIEKTEVIRGPQSALWGSDALAGVINITTKRGEGPLRATAFMEGGSFGTGHGGANISKGGDRYHFNLGGSYINSTGNNISRDGNEDDGYENGTVSISAGYSPTENLSFDVTSRFTEANNEFDATDFVTGLPSDSDRETKTSQNYSRLQSKLTLYDGLWDHKLGLSLINTDNDNFTNGSEADSTQGKKYKLDYQTSVYLETSEFADASHVITFAFEHDIEEYTQRGQAAFGNDPNLDLDIDISSYIGEYRVTFSDVFSASASVRHDSNSDFDDSTSYRLSAAYLLPEYGLGLRASYGTGVKNPNFTERFGFFSTAAFFPFIGNPDLSPEESRGWEVGLDKSFLDEKLRLGLTYFNERLKDEINGFVIDFAAGTSTAINEDGKSKRQGVELTATAFLTENLSLNTNYTYLDADQPSPFGGREREVRRPEHIANFNLSYVLMDERLNVNLNLNYNGEQDDVFFAPPFFAREIVSLDSFALLNLAASYRYNDRISVYGRIENLLDDNYEEVLGFQNTGIGAYAGVRLNFSP